ncbi:YciI family protein [Geodermatophilus sp. SYSU D01105]
MRFMVIVKASEASESGVLPTQQELAEMGAFNEQLVKAGVMLAGEGLQPSSTGLRLRYDREGKSTVVDGPFAETKELIAGFWILQVSSREEVVEWMRRAPFRDGEVEIRQVAEAEDFGEAFTPELREQEDRLRATVEAQQQA